MRASFLRSAIACGAALLTALSADEVPATAQSNVRVTPLGSHAGELCARDRAFVFEDPSGVRLLYDPGFMVDEADPRLGDIHVVLLSHAHNDHIGSRRDRGGTCAAPTQGPANPQSNVASIAAAKNAIVMTATEATVFLAAKIQNIRGTSPPACPSAGFQDETTVPMAGPCTAPLGVSGRRAVKRAGSSAAVQITGVQALHPSNIPAALVDAPGLAPATTAYAGLAQGFVVRFTNGLTAYLTGDTGIFGDMQHVIARLHRPQLVVINIGPGGNGPTSLGPDDAADVVRTLVRPNTVLPSHVGEQATSGGALRGGTRTELFATLVRSFVDVVLPLSDVTMSFDGDGRCIGCPR